ncbi:MAG: hypothetical protein HQ526_11445 [Actinobacteria bacterium]|nr:hypothetical protein [Actinomycetota bacterium]
MSDFGYSIFAVVVGAGDPNPTPSGGLESIVPAIDPNIVTPGMWGFISFVALIFAAVILYFSLRKQLKRVDFPDDSAGDSQTETGAGPRNPNQR